MFQIIFRIGVIQLLAIAVSLARSKVTAVLLGPEGVGIVSVIDQVVQLAAHICALSLPLAAIKVLSVAHSRSEAEFRSAYAGMLRLLSVFSLLGAGGAVLLAWARAPWFNPGIPNFTFYMTIAALNIPTMVLGGFLTNVLAAAGKVTASASMAVGTNTVMTVASYVGISLGRVAGMYAATVIAGAIFTLSVLLLLHRKLHLRVTEKPAPLIGELRKNGPTLLYSLMLYTTSITYSGSLLAVRYTVLHSRGEAEAGLLQSALAISLALGLILNPMNGLFLTPLVNRDIPRRDKMKAAIDFQKRLMVIMTLAAMALCLFPELLVRILFSPLFARAAQWVPLLVVSQCLLQIAGIYQALLVGFDDVVVYGVLTAAGHLLLTVLAMFWGRTFGMDGVAAAFLTAGATTAVLTFWRLRMRFGFHMTPATLAFLVYPLAAILGVQLFVRGAASFTAAAILVKLAVYGTVAATLFLLLSREERQSLYTLVQRSKSAAR